MIRVGNPIPAGPGVAASGDDLFQPLGPLDIKDGSDLVEVAGKQRLRFTVPVRQPLVLISQIQRSGGTLMSQLLDGHSELHVHPSELHIGRPSKYYWPHLDLSEPPVELFQKLHEPLVLRFARLGYQKLGVIKSNTDPSKRDLVLPFIFSTQVQEQVFERMLATPPATQREALDAYATSYFNAWLDYAGLYRPPEAVRYWVAFAARLIATPGEAETMLADYPDGKLVIPFREPQSWLASARTHSPEYDDVHAALRLWNAAHRASLKLFRANPKSVRLVPFEDMVGDIEACMRRVAAFLGIRFEPSLLTPTFNGMPILSNSAFEAVRGVDPRSLDRADQLDTATQALVRERTEAVYGRLRAIAERQRASASEA